MSHLHGMHRTSDKFYTSRPPANCKSARIAWDYHAATRPIKRLRLLDGYWGAERESGHWDELENCYQNCAPPVRAPAQGPGGQP